MCNEKPTAFITGVTGQDGSLLADLLLKSGYEVYGGFRRGSSNKIWRLNYLGIIHKIKLVEFQLNEPQNLIEILQTIKPDEIYNLAAESYVSDSFKYPGVTLDANTHGTINLLDAARLVVPKSKLFFASSSEIFGYNPLGGQLNEDSQFFPSNPYAISKLAADYYVKLYREKYNLFSCSGILFNHEGPLRTRQFVSRKISFNISRLKIDGGLAIELGDFNSARDWGAATDYVEAMRLILAQDEPSDFIIATGILSSVRDILKISAIAAGFDPVFEGDGLTEVCVDKVTGKIIAKVAERYFRPFDTEPLSGNSLKLKSKTGWNNEVGLEEMLYEMVYVDIDRRKKGLIDV
jgi:GDPmannose 4,6-dehydratase